ncbi:MAG: hypothetical protein RLY30_1217 [Pseudomonadota bacterium]|jgi:branched-chain amino acid transport system permease protein
MLSRLLSHDWPQGGLLRALLVTTAIVLLTAPFLGFGATGLNVAAKVLVFILLVASFDLLLGYSGHVSFAHTMFFGVGAYGLALSMKHLGTTVVGMLAGLGGALLVSLVLSVLIGVFSLRVRAIFFAMITLAVAAVFQTFVAQQSWLTGGEDGINFRLPEFLEPSYRLIEGGLMGLDITGRVLSYYLLFVVVLVCFLALLRIVNSPFGRVLQALRENDFRAKAIGYDTLWFRVAASVLSALFATVAGFLLSLWLRYSGPDVSLSFELMVDILLMLVIGGMGTIYGAVLGATLFLLAQSYLRDLLALCFEALEGHAGAVFFDPDRWLFWLGLLFIVSVYTLPMGLVGKLRNKG